MGIFFSKKNAEEKEPEYYLSATNIPTINYKVYYMKTFEKIAYFVLAFVVGAAVGYLFYGGIGKDELGQPTNLTRVLDIVIPSVVGLLAGKMYLPIRTRQIKEKRIRILKNQFRDMLESVATSLGAGKNVPDSFIAAYNDMRVQYSDDAYIVKEIEVINSGIQNNIAIEDLLVDFGIRSGIEDVMSFANVFNICYRKGGNIKDIIKNTYAILSEKMEIEEDIETIVTANKTEQTIMIFLPIGLVAVIKMMSPEFAANFSSLVGIISTSIAIGAFVIAYFIGREILDIKV
ncbi:type II secretion system F family protein [Acetivibrio clariflavus]|uniref:type II secretion system F family protein n=1 Tax=Acetivibrio clariflavus TaxID=288965 RepID=UPI0004841426|nr:hypothetical protein [Acetivibrio clariflavus]